MREVGKLMIQEFNMRELGYDFMGYEFANENALSFHHLIVPRRLSNQLPNKGYIRENGAILVQNSSHEYLHRIELYDRDMFLAITKWMIKENQIGKLDIEYLKKIHDILTCFEREYADKENNGKKLIKEKYLRRKEFK